jgi:hypothetical protein
MDKLAIGKSRISLKDEEKLIKNSNLTLPGELNATIELVVREGIFNPDGKITTQIGPKRSESFTRQFLELLWMQAMNVYYLTGYRVRDINNTLKNVFASNRTFDVTGAIAAVDKGIIVGTGNTAPTINDYAIETIIPHDAAPPTAGAMQYSAVTFGAPASDATTSQFTITRNFANASGGAITVNEIALYCYAYWFATAYSFMTIRDVIAGGIAVPNGQTLTVNYRPQGVV